jgi:hypothetical protein
MKLLHMVPSLPDRVPTFTMFGNNDYFFETASAASKGKNCSQPPVCLVEEGPSGFAWNHGDFQTQITRTWYGMVGPGVRKLGRNDSVFSDHTDLRPTLMTLVGLMDDYVHDGRVLVEVLESSALPDALEDSRHDYIELAKAFKEINATKGLVGRKSLIAANRAITSDDATYGKFLTNIGAITDERNNLASEMIGLLEGAAFGKKPINEHQEDDLVKRANRLIDKVEDLAARRE